MANLHLDPLGPHRGQLLHRLERHAHGLLEDALCVFEVVVALIKPGKIHPQLREFPSRPRRIDGLHGLRVGNDGLGGVGLGHDALRGVQEKPNALPPFPDVVWVLPKLHVVQQHVVVVD